LADVEPRAAAQADAIALPEVLSFPCSHLAPDKEMANLPSVMAGTKLAESEPDRIP